MTACRGCSTQFFRLAWLMALGMGWSWIPVHGQDSWRSEQYTSENGLLQNRVHAMELDPWGGILAGTEGGLVRFDGEHFKQIGIPAPEGMLPSRVLEIIPVPDHAYVIRDAGSHLYLYRDNRLEPITADAPARKPLSRFIGPGVSVDVIVQALDPDSTLEGKNEWPYGVRLVDLGGHKWCVKTDNDILIYQDRSLLNRVPIPKGRWSHVFVLDQRLFIFDTVGRAYWVDWQQGLIHQVPTWGFPSPVQHDGQLNWRFNYEPKAGFATLTTSSEVYTFQWVNGGLQAQRIPVELPSESRLGGLLWLNNGQTLAVGTDTKGLFVFRRNTMRTLVCDMAGDGVNNAYFTQAPNGPDGVITSARGGVRMFNKNGCIAEKPPIPVFDESAILLDKRQRYWYGRGDTLYMYGKATGKEEVVATDLRPLCFVEHDGSVYVGSNHGIHVLRGDSLILTLPLMAQDLSSRPTALCFTPQGALWAATCSGVYEVMEDGHWKPVHGLAGICARTLTVQDNDVLIGTYGSGAFIYRNGKPRPLPMDQDGFLSHVHAFMPDAKGFLWMSSNQGLFRVKRSDLEAWLNDPKRSIFLAYYGRRSGISNSEFNGGCSPPYVLTASGWASFPTMDGLVWFQPEQVPDAFPSAPILLEGIVVDGTVIDTTESLRLPWDHREVTIQFSMAYWGTPENARLEYSISGSADGNWTLIRPGQNKLHFPTLAQGNNTIRIRKVGGGIRGDKDVLELHFSVPAPFYRTYWFIGAVIAAIALLFWLVLRLNAARLRRRNLQLEKMVRARTSELVSSNTELRKSLEMKEMLVSIISHDIVTPLRFIARVSSGAANGLQQQDPERLGETLQDIARSSDKLHINAQGLLHWIKQQDGRIELNIRNVAAHALVEEVLGMEHERALDKGLTLVNRTSEDDVIPTDRNVLSIILHNLVANAVTHTASGEVSVTGAIHGPEYQMEIRDSGNGMPEAALKHAIRVQGRGALGAMNEEGERDVQGLGLLIVADLLHILGGSFEVNSVKGQGTTVTVHIPIDRTTAARTRPYAATSP